MAAQQGHAPDRPKIEPPLMPGVAEIADVIK